MLGFTTIIAQTILLRECLNVFYGNELVIGIILSNWMILTGLGAYLGKFAEKKAHRPGNSILLVIYVGILPVITVFLLHFLRNIVFQTGSMISIVQMIYASFILLMPVCILSGMLFTVFSIYLSKKYQQNLISKVYTFEALGSVIGGLIFNFLFIYLFKTFESLIILAVLNLILASLLLYDIRKNILLVLIIPLTGIFIWAGLHYPLDRIAKSFLYPQQSIIYQKDTPYGNLTVTQQKNQINFYENNVLLSSSHDVKSSEETVHYAMSQHPAPEQVLLIGGGISGTINEMLKYDITQLDYVEMNPWVIDLIKQYAKGINDSSVRIINQDARLYIKNTSRNYDVVIMDLPQPNTAQINRYYTINFMHELEKILKPHSVFSLSLSATGNYMSKEAQKSQSVIYQTLNRVFDHILIIPGSQNYFLCSRQSLSYDIPRLISEKNISTDYVNKYYLNTPSIKERGQSILQHLNQQASVNKDFRPVAYFRQLQHWLSYFQFNYWLIAIGLGLVMLFILFKARNNPVNIGLFFGGFAGSSVEVLILLAFQVIYGYVYHIIGIVVMLFMGGLAFGANYRHKLFKTPLMQYFHRTQLIIGIFCLMVPFILLLFKSIDANIYLLHSIFFILIFSIASLIGMLFNLASRVQQLNIATTTSEIYSIDLWGSAIGSLVVTAYLIPLLGLVQVAIITGVLNILASLFSFFKGRNSSTVPSF